MVTVSDVYVSLKSELAGSTAQVILPGDGEAYEQSIKRWSEHCEKRAACVVKVASGNDITATLKFVQKNKIPFVVKGGGHSTYGNASIEDGLVIDLSLMRKVVVDQEKKTIWAEGGTLWGDVDVEAAKFGLAVVGGMVNHTGVGGLTLGGGYGYLSGRYGLVIDNLLSVDVVLASGEQLTASETENPDLFWAIRGAGQNFGVTTAFTFRAHPQNHPVFAGILTFLSDKLPQVIAFANKFHTTNDGNQAMICALATPPPTNTPVILVLCFHNGTKDEGTEYFKELIEAGPVMDTIAMIPYEEVNTLFNPAAGFDGRKMFGGGAFKLPLSMDYVQDLFKNFLDFVTVRDTMSGSLLLFEIVPCKKILEVPNHKMAFSNRGEYYNLAAVFKWFDPTLDAEIRDFSHTFLKKATAAAGITQDKKVRSTEGVGMYSNFVNVDIPASEIYGSNAKKLEVLKQKYDPDNLFDKGVRLVPRP